MTDILRAVGLDAATADTLAGIHLEADLRGVSVQGLNHLINSHIQDIESGRIDPAARPEVVREGPGQALIDGRSATGPLAGLLAAPLAARKAKETGCAVVGVRNSHDMFQAGYYAELMAAEGVIGFVFSDDVVPVVRPLGGVEPLIGSNPMAMAVPTEGVPFVLDFAPTATLPTYVRYAKRYGIPLPEGVARDAAGRPTTDPETVTDGAGFQPTKGAIDPLGHKGYGLLLLIEFLSGALLGCEMGHDHALKPGARKGHLFMAIDPGTFVPAEEVRRAVGARIAALKASRPEPGSEGVRVPGERSHAARARALELGVVAIDEMCWQDTLAVAARLGVAVPA